MQISQFVDFVNFARTAARIRTWWKQCRCAHDWHPSSYRKLFSSRRTPAKHCVRCDKTVEMSPERFYAEFGRWF
jgi:hypothetical protein